MLRRIIGGPDLRQAIELRRLITDGQADLAAAWLTTTGAWVLAKESGRHLEPEEALSLAETYFRQGATHLVAVVTDSLAAEEEAYALESAADDLNELSRELAGVNFLLTDTDASRCVLFTTDDFKLVAGPMPFVEGFVGDPQVASEAFAAFRGDSLEDLQPILERAATYMWWVAAR